MIKSDITKSLIFKSIIYAVFVIAFSTGISIYTHFNKVENQIFLNSMMLILVTLFFLPLVLLKNKRFSLISDLGLKYNKKSVNATIVIILLLSALTGLQTPPEITFTSKIVEGVARTGEEFFFRGFIYFIILAIFSNNKKKGLIAVFASSLIFTISHTQIFLGTYHLSFLSMLINTIIVFGLLRYYFESILPPVAVHTFMNGGIVSCIIGVMITGLLMTISHIIDRKFVNENAKTINSPEELIEATYIITKTK